MCTRFSCDSVCFTEAALMHMTFAQRQALFSCWQKDRRGSSRRGRHQVVGMGALYSSLCNQPYKPLLLHITVPASAAVWFVRSTRSAAGQLYILPTT